MIGYYFVFAIRHYQIKKNIIKKIEQNAISENNLILVKVPISLPYTIDWDEYRSASGSFEHKGRFFEKVKQILQKDTMLVYCIENKGRKKLFDELNLHTQTQIPAWDKYPNSTHTEKEATFVFLKDYLPYIYSDFLMERFYKKSSFTTYHLQKKYSAKQDTPVPPPQIA